MAAASYDYIIIGAGSAGCVLANRLTADGTTRDVGPGQMILLAAGEPLKFFHFSGYDPDRPWEFSKYSATRGNDAAAICTSENNSVPVCCLVG